MRIHASHFSKRSAHGLPLFSDKVRWRHYPADGEKEAHIAVDPKSLISRKLSMEVSIHRITKLSSSGELGSSFDRRDEYEGQPQSGNDGVQVQVQAALDLFHETRRDMGNDWLRNSRLCVLEQDTYILCNQKVYVLILLEDSTVSIRISPSLHVILRLKILSPKHLRLLTEIRSELTNRASNRVTSIFETTKLLISILTRSYAWVFCVCTGSSGRGRYATCDLGAI